MAGGTILGISPGTRYVGVAMLRNGDLYDWKVKTYKGSWSEDKLSKAIEYIEGLIITHVIHHIACKIPHTSRSSFGLNALIEKIKKIAKEYKIELHIYSVNDLKSFFKKDISNKSQLANHLAVKHPELSLELDKEQRSNHSYYSKMFEAIAAGMHCHKERSM